MAKSLAIASVVYALATTLGVSQTLAQARAETTAASPAAEIGRYTIYTADMDRSIAFWVDGFGYSVRSENMQLSGPVIEKSFHLKPGTKMRFVVLEAGKPGGTLIGLMSSLGEPFGPLSRSSDGAPLAGETFVLVRVPDIYASFAKLKRMGIEINTEPVLIPSGTIEGSVVTPEGNRVVVQQAK